MAYSRGDFIFFYLTIITAYEGRVEGISAFVITCRSLSGGWLFSRRFAVSLYQFVFEDRNKWFRHHDRASSGLRSE
jgi:hypothetical protein